MTDYERGTPAWDIGMLLTRHNDGHSKGQHHDFSPCAKVLDLRRTACQGMAGHERLQKALKVTCTCGAGESLSEQTSLGETKEAA